MDKAYVSEWKANQVRIVNKAVLNAFLFGMMVIHLLKMPRGVNYYEDVLLFDISLMNK